VLGASLAVLAIAVAGGFGLLPSGPDRSDAATSLTASQTRTDAKAEVDETAPTEAAVEPAADQAVEASAMTGLADADGSSRIAASTETTGLPPRSGKGRRIVFSESRQRVWLVDSDGGVQQTYLVSGSIEDNLEPGTYAVYSRSRNAVGIDDSGTMEYFVRFTQGTQGAAIGFHTIPVDDGAPVQTLKQLGTPLSHGCIRQKRADAIDLWDFAPIGTTVVVTA
jgi:lipoprotein-anchoring transpeptidase ErfK/SrfK